ncbi:MAG: hypothetical protein IPO09_12240 [Anaeromyxobacter sp.]|nr:hypothetical protein [Anaeromyxobacter sp.]MBL0276351.1 hypothetical protein [Anaeromyxobacter sp.]
MRTLLLLLALAPTLALSQAVQPTAPPGAFARSVEAQPEGGLLAPPAEAAPSGDRDLVVPAPPGPPPSATEVAAATLPVPPAPPAAEAPYPQWGFDVGVGVPQGAQVSVLYRPLPWVRLGLGPSWDYAGWGVHGGATLTPLRWAVSPTLGVEAGRFFRLDVTRFASGVSAETSPLLERIQVQYLAALLGLEFGSQRGFAFALRLGLTWIEADSDGTGSFTGTGGTNGSNSAEVTVTDPTFRVAAPTLQLAFQYFF